MKFIADIREGETLKGIYLCKKKLTLKNKNGKEYESLTLQDKTGTLDAKIWDPGNAGIEDFAEGDFIEVIGDVKVYMNRFQLSVKRARKCREEEYNPADYIPSTKKNIEAMYKELIDLANTVKNPYLRKLIIYYFVEDKEFREKFKKSSAAKTVHHSYVGGLLEHTLGVMKLCDAFAKNYSFLDRDLLITAALFHDIGKTRELSAFPANDYTDEGQMIGHIVIGVEMVNDAIRTIPDFPETLANELRHCILAHHGELEYGSPKVPALAEAAALNFADNADAKLEIFRETFEADAGKENSSGWLGWQSLLNSNIRRTTE